MLKLFTIIFRYGLVLLITLLIFQSEIYCQIKSKQLIIKPNPTTGRVTLDVQFTLMENLDYNIDTKIEIYSSDGELLASSPINSHISGAGNYIYRKEFDLSGNASGLYIVRTIFLGDLLVSKLMLLK
jgi:hypothetical protein